MRVGVTGGAGFIGGYTCEALAAAGHEPLVFDHKGRTYGNFDFMLGDVRDETAMVELAAHVDGIIHLAAVLGTQETIQNPRPAAESNLSGGLNFLIGCAQYNLPGVYICVGNHWMNNTYSISKTAVERFVRMFNKERGTRVNCVRAVNAYGPRQSVAPPFGPAKVRKITPAFVCRALTGQDIEVYGDGNQVSDMVYVADVAETMVTALEAARDGNVPDETIECGPIRSHTVNEVAEWVATEAEVRGYAPVGVKHLPMRPGEVPGDRVTANTDTLAHIEVDPREFVGLEEGIGRTVDYYVEARGKTWDVPG